MTKIAVKPIHVYAEIRRVDEEARTLEAYAFVNEVVEGEGGLRLKRTAMEAATPDYMNWANVRRMHTPDAVGVAENVTWDESGALMTVKVEDEDAWNKVKARVYKGLSVGIAATVMRGKDVEACRWFETSLVDRPADPDAKILAFRAEGIEPGATFEAESEEVKRSVNDWLEEIKESDTRQDLYQAFDWLMNCLWDCMDDPAQMSQNLDEFGAYCKTVIGQAETGRAALEGTIKRLKGGQAADPEEIKRIAALETQSAAVLERAAAAESELATVRTELTERSAALSAAEERVKTLERMPYKQGPVKYPAAALARTFTANEVDGVDPERVNQLRAELNKLVEETPKEPDQQKRQAAVTKVLTIQGQLRELGVEA